MAAYPIPVAAIARTTAPTRTTRVALLLVKRATVLRTLLQKGGDFRSAVHDTPRVIARARRALRSRPLYNAVALVGSADLSTGVGLARASGCRPRFPLPANKTSTIRRSSRRVQIFCPHFSRFGAYVGQITTMSPQGSHMPHTGSRGSPRRRSPPAAEGGVGVRVDCRAERAELLAAGLGH